MEDMEKKKDSKRTYLENTSWYDENYRWDTLWHISTDNHQKLASIDLYEAQK